MAVEFRYSANTEFLLSRVAQARADGETATLKHVKKRCQRSQVAWQQLADKSIEHDRVKMVEAERKAAAQDQRWLPRPR